jgi:hypothetical protein
MAWKIAAELYFLAPFAFVALPLFVVETARAVAAIRAERG